MRIVPHFCGDDILRSLFLRRSAATGYTIIRIHCGEFSTIVRILSGQIPLFRAFQQMLSGTQHVRLSYVQTLKGANVKQP
jgi:hypothetical protein